jgi:hypothetical protein
MTQETNKNQYTSISQTGREPPEGHDSIATFNEVSNTKDASYLQSTNAVKKQ